MICVDKAGPCFDVDADPGPGAGSEPGPGPGPGSICVCRLDVTAVADGGWYFFRNFRIFMSVSTSIDVVAGVTLAGISDGIVGEGTTWSATVSVAFALALALAFKFALALFAAEWSCLRLNRLGLATCIMPEPDDSGGCCGTCNVCTICALCACGCGCEF